MLNQRGMILTQSIKKEIRTPSKSREEVLIISLEVSRNLMRPNFSKKNK